MATGTEQIHKQQKVRQEWAACDPVTLVAAARETLYSEFGGEKGGENSAQFAPIEEVLSRFDQQTRASMGSVVGASSLSGSRSSQS